MGKKRSNRLAILPFNFTCSFWRTYSNSIEIIGTTLDDAVGEAFDKVAKILGLPYPGGPSIAKLAINGNETKYSFPHPKVEGLNFSFSGLKTAVLRRLQKELTVPISYPSHDIKNIITQEMQADFSASFQITAIEILLEKIQSALELYPEVNNIIIAGGVSANEKLREKAENFAEKNQKKVFFPERKYSGDNATMVGIAALS